MKRSSSSARTAATLSDSLCEQLNMYSLGATATANFNTNLFGSGAALTAIGLGVLASALPAAAKIVYTPANITIPSQVPVPLDLNHDGVNDLSISWDSWGHGKAIDVALKANAVIGYTKNNRVFAAALKGGVSVGPKKKFVTDEASMWIGNDSSGSVTSRGPWLNVQNRYLGVKFSIKGKTHYGWVRLNVSEDQPGIKALITGYAYETVADRPIVAGKKKGPYVDGPDAALTTRPAQSATLGLLALGSPGLSIWRRKEWRETA
jgi:hypothetical protein